MGCNGNIPSKGNLFDQEKVTEYCDIKVFINCIYNLLTNFFVSILQSQETPNLNIVQMYTCILEN